MTEAFPAGARVLIHGLTSIAGQPYNGTEAVVSCWRKDIERLELRVAHGKSLACREVNLRRLVPSMDSPTISPISVSPSAAQPSQATQASPIHAKVPEQHLSQQLSKPPLPAAFASPPASIPPPRVSKPDQHSLMQQLPDDSDALKKMVVDQQRQLVQLRGLVRLLLLSGQRTEHTATASAREALALVPAAEDSVRADDDEDELPAWLKDAALYLDGAEVSEAAPTATSCIASARVEAAAVLEQQQKATLDRAAWASHQQLDAWAQSVTVRPPPDLKQNERDALQATQGQLEGTALVEESSELLRRARRAWAELDMAARDQLR